MQSCCGRAEVLWCGTAGDSQSEAALKSLTSDWEEAVRWWQADHSAYCTMQDQHDEEEREAAWARMMEEREQQSLKNQKLDSDIDRWAKQQQKEAAAAAVAAEMASRSVADEVPDGPSSSSGNKAFGSSTKSQSCAPQRVAVTSLLEIDDVSRGEIPVSVYGLYRTAQEKTKTGEFKTAASLLGEVLDQCPTGRVPVGLLGMRAACHLHQGHYKLCLADCENAIKISGSYTLGYARAARCHLMLGRLAEARNMINIINVRALPYDTAKDVSLIELVAQFERNMREGNYEAALKYITEACVAIPEAPLEVKRVECLGKLQPEDALDDAKALVEAYPNDADSLYLRAWLEYLCSTDSASYVSLQQYLLKAMSCSDGEHTRAKALLQTVKQVESHRSLAQSYSATRRWKQALQEFNHIISMIGDNPRLQVHLLLQRGQVYLGMENFNSCVIDCTTALNKRLSHHRAALYALRSEAYETMGKMDEAIADAREENRSRPSQRCEEKVQRLLRLKYARQNQHSEQPRQEQRTGGARSRPSSAPPRRPMTATHYDTLGVALFAEGPAIAKAFHRAALKWHPDKWVSASAAEQHIAIEKFKALNHAYGILSEESSRKAYDAELGRRT